MAARQGWARHKADAPLTDMLPWRSSPSSWAIIQAVQQTAAAEAEQPVLWGGILVSKTSAESTVTLIFKLLKQGQFD